MIARAYQDRFGLSIPQWRLVCLLPSEGGLTQAQIGRLQSAATALAGEGEPPPLG